MGLAFAGLLANVRFRGRDLVDVLVTAPIVLPPTVLGYYVLVAFGRRSGIGEAIEAVFGSPIVFTRTGAVLAATVGALPLVVKSGRAALEAVDPTLLRAARSLGAGPMRAFFTVQLPLARRGVTAALMLGFARSLGDFGITLMVAGDIPGETQTALSPFTTRSRSIEMGSPCAGGVAYGDRHHGPLRREQAHGDR